MSKATFELTTEDVRNACDVLLPVHQATPEDGRVSIEVDPFLANDTAGSIKSAQDLWAAVDRPNCLIKIPATEAGLPAIRAAIGAGHQRQRHADLQQRALPPGDGRLPGRPRGRPGDRHRPVDDPLGGVVLRLPCRHRGRQAARRDRHRRGRRTARRGRGRQRPARLRGVRGGLRLRPVRRPPRRRRPRPAAAVGLDRRQGRALPRHQVRHRPRRRQHRQHDAREDPGGVRRPRRGAGRPGDGQGRRGARSSSTGCATSASTSTTSSTCSSARGWRSSRSPGRSSSTRSRASSTRPDREPGRGSAEPEAPTATAWNTVAGDGPGIQWELFFGYRDEAAFAAQVQQLVADRFASRLAARDHTLWGEAAEEESAKRLGWVDLSATSQPLVIAINALRDELHGAGLTRVVLCGMGGSSLAPEVICGAAGVPLDVLDSSDPDFVRTAIDTRPRPHRGGRLLQVRRHRRDRQPAPGVREGVLRRRHRRPRADRRRDRPGLAARPVRLRGRVPRLPRRPDRGRPVLRADRVRPGAQRVGRGGHRRAAGRGRGDPRCPRAGLRRQPRAAPRGTHRRGQPGRRRQAGAVQRRGPVRRVRRLGRAADRRVDRQGRQGRAARHRRVADLAELRAQQRRRGARVVRARLAVRRRAHQVRLGAQRGRPARRADAPLGARDRRGGRDHRHQPVRPARRRERQGRVPRPCSTAVARSPSRASPTARSPSTPHRAGCRTTSTPSATRSPS